MKKIRLVWKKIRDAIFHPLAFLRYVSMFSEYRQGQNFAFRGFPATGADAGRLEDRSELLSFFLDKPHRGMTKWLHYCEAYEPHFAQLRATRKPLRILEIGVFSGGSLQMYQSYFKDVTLEIVGVDIDPECRSFQSDGVVVEIGDQEDRSFWKRFKDRHPPFDMVIDDGGHATEQQISSFESLIDHVAPGGVYIIEDLLSPWNRFGAYLAGLCSGLHQRVDNSRGTVTPQAIQKFVLRAEILPYAVIFKTRSLNERPGELSSPWKGTSWTATATRLFQQGNNGQFPPTT